MRESNPFTDNDNVGLATEVSDARLMSEIKGAQV